MKIHVVAPGDNVFSLSRKYGVPESSIIRSNGLENGRRLVVGEALVIPSKETAYTVAPGDSLWSIAKKFGVSTESIARLNNISVNSALTPGQVIRIPDRAKNYGYVETNAFIIPSTPQRENGIMAEAGPYLTYISPFSRHVTANGSLTPLNDTNIKLNARRYRNAVMLSVTNIGAGGNFDTELINNILTNTGLRATLINNIVSEVRTGGYYGAIIDFERISPDNRERYNSFLRELTARLHRENYISATALAPKTSDVKTGSWHGAHDYRAHGEIVDFVIIMTYEWGWSGGPPLAVAPLNEVRKVISYAVSVIPPKKIMLGMPFYGYDWGLPYVPGGEFAEALGLQEAVERAGSVGAQIKYDNKSQSPFYNYFDKDKTQHVVWFEDARSYQAKYKLVNEFNLRGVSFWALGKPFPQGFEVLDNMFFITKVV